MPALLKTKLDIPTYVKPPETTYDLDWAPLVSVDLSKFDEPGGKERLAADLHDAAQRWGFWIVTGSGISEDQIIRQLSIADAFFKLPLEEKKKYPCDFAVGNYFGYREPTRFIGDSDVKENMEMLNIPKFIPEYESVQQSDFIKQFHDEIAPFHRRIYENVIRKLMVLFAIILELPEDYFVERHEYERPSEDHMRYMIYHPRAKEEDDKIGHLWSAGHTDFGSLTLLFAQNVAALQIRTPSNEWKWIKPVPGGIVCNAADTLSFLTKGYIKSTVHRVVRPPQDQASFERLGLFYFVRPANDALMVPAPSPVLRRAGILMEEDEVTNDAVTGYEYVRARVKDVHHRKNTRITRGPEAKFKVKNLEIPDIYV